ncbi:hypothetical protein ACFJGV_12860 [Cnuibacter sp. UC19_7]|uniref:hypothetical protein n=1 Tax=Cnuibacter sp. UC19_7 TaxID=3350166 RepID=UPI00366DD226
MDSPEMPRLDPPTEVVADIDRKAARLRAEPESFAAMDGLWRAVYGLERWIFLARGTEEAPKPYAGELSPGPMLFAFTTPDRAREGGRSVGLSDEESSLLLAVPLPGAIEWAASFGQAGIAGIAFDIPSAGYYAPLGNLLPMRDHMAANPPAV